MTSSVRASPRATSPASAKEESMSVPKVRSARTRPSTSDSVTGGRGVDGPRP
jgi:hypothetical protein